MLSGFSQLATMSYSWAWPSIVAGVNILNKGSLSHSVLYYLLLQCARNRIKMTILELVMKEDLEQVIQIRWCFHHRIGDLLRIEFMQKRIQALWGWWWLQAGSWPWGQGRCLQEDGIVLTGHFTQIDTYINDGGRCTIRLVNEEIVCF